MGQERILIGRFGAPHGVAGEIRLQSFSAEPQAIASYQPLTDESGERQFAISRLRPVKANLFVVKIEGVDDRTSAAELVNAGIYVRREALADLDEEEFYLVDLIGLTVETETGEVFGKVADVQNFGGGDILEIVRPTGGDTILWPFTKVIFPQVDLAAGRLIVVPPNETEIAASAPAPEC